MRDCIIRSFPPVGPDREVQHLPALGQEKSGPVFVVRGAQARGDQQPETWEKKVLSAREFTRVGRCSEYAM
jgi:hypothetical protein